MDLPTIAERANEKIASPGLSDRVRAVGLDAFDEEFPKGCDAVLFGHVLEIWPIARDKELLAKTGRAVEPGAGIFVITPGADDDGTGPTWRRRCRRTSSPGPAVRAWSTPARSTRSGSSRRASSRPAGCTSVGSATW